MVYIVRIVNSYLLLIIGSDLYITISFYNDQLELASI